MGSETDLYQVLDVPPSASSEDIRNAYYRQVRKHPPEKDAEGFQLVQRAYEVLGNAETRKEYDDQRRADPETRRLIDEGRRLLEDNDLEAVTPLKRALVRQPDSLVTRDLLVQALVLGEDYDTAEKHARLLIRRAPDNPVYHQRLGDLLRKVDRDAEAEDPYRRALELDRETPQPVVKLAYLLTYLGRSDDAVTLLRKAILRDGRIDFEDFLFFQTLCRVYINRGELGKLQEVRTEIRKILPPDPETRSFVAWFYYTDALALAEHGNFDAALSMIEEAAGIDDSLPELRETHLRIRNSKGALEEILRLKDDTSIMPELRFSAGPLVLMRVLGLKDYEETFEQATQALTLQTTIEGSPLARQVEDLRRRYPATAAILKDFLDAVADQARSAPKTHINIKCPGCGEEHFAEGPSIQTLTRGGLTVAQAAQVLQAHGREYAKKYLIYSCEKCGTHYNGQSERVAPGQRAPGTAVATGGCATEAGKGLLLFAAILAFVVGSMFCDSISQKPSGSRGSRYSPRPTAAPQRQWNPPGVPQLSPTQASATNYHVKVDALNLRTGPGSGYDPVIKLRKFQDVDLVADARGGWAQVRTKSGTVGFVAAQYLAYGSGQAAEREWCRANAGTRPFNGEILLQRSRGPHKLIIKNEPWHDAIFKLKDRRGRTVLSFYIRGSETATVAAVPGGSFAAIYATGAGYSRQCGYFLDDLAVRKLDESADFTTTEIYPARYNTVLSYTLYTVAKGNITPQTASLEDLLD